MALEHSAVLNLAKARGENSLRANPLENFSCDRQQILRDEIAAHTLLLDRCKSGSDDYYY